MGSLPQREQDRRRESWRQANASIRLEGGAISPEFVALQEQHIRGEISRVELRAQLAEIERGKAGGR